MFDWLKPAKPSPFWAIKQIDEDLLHLCGRALLEGHPKRVARRAVTGGDCRGAVRMQKSGLVLNAELFEALIPIDELHLENSCHAVWRGRRYRIAWVAQRSWTYRGPFVTAPALIDGEPGLSSVEDVSGIRDKLARTEVPSRGGSLEMVPSEALAEDEPHHRRAPRKATYFAIGEKRLHDDD